MRTGVGVSVVVVAGALGLLLLARWRHLPARTASICAAAVGAAVGAGALLLQDDPGVADWVIAVGLLGSVAPLHARMLVGPADRAS
ncbi:MAG: hypothetical protein ACM3WR_02475 [Solirubrobacterales bacterium]